MIMKTLVKFICCKFLYKVNYIGLENLNSVDTCLICPNHSNIFDPFFIYPVTNNLYIMAKAELFRNKILAKLLYHYNVFPVDRTKRDPKSLFTALNIFNKDEHRKLLIFPEGGILKTDDEIGKKIRNGATYISGKLGLPIIPVYITRRPKLFSKVTVIFGKSFCVDNEILEDKEKLKNKSKELVETIYSLNYEKKV